jgi:2-amino-4-hydroxy-6-hydroxymethyldihydropteridine diphosphokinase
MKSGEAAARDERPPVAATVDVAEGVAVEAAAVDRSAEFGSVMSQPALWQPAYVGLGSNLGDPRHALRRAIELVGSLPDTRLVVVSSHYRTAPFGPIEQDPFINGVAGVLTRQSPVDFLRALRSVERQLGRAETRVRWGPREIDLDLLAYGDCRLSTDELTLPHAGIPERDFVLYPLRDIAPQLHLPGMGRVAELASRVTDRGIERLD